MTRLAVLGASGHAKVVGDTALRAGWQRVIFFDDRWPALRMLGPWQVIGTTDDLVRTRHDFEAAVVAIGHNRTRLALQRRLVSQDILMATIVDPNAVMSQYAEVGAGTVVFAGAVLNAFAVVGAATIINTAATVDHDCVLGDGVHISPGAHLGGSVRVGEGTWIGIGAAVRQGIVIGADVVVGAGAAVVSDIAAGLTVGGVPARPLKNIAVT